MHQQYFYYYHAEQDAEYACRVGKLFVEVIAERTVNSKETDLKKKILRGDQITDGWFNRFMEKMINYLYIKKTPLPM